jgi:hypothetical protein
MVEYSYKNGVGKGYLALPSGGRGAGVGMLVCHAWWR